MKLFKVKCIVIFAMVLISYQSNASKIQWSKFLKDTTRVLNTEFYAIQGKCVDSNNNIYYCYSNNSADSIISFVSKISADGEILWHKDLFPLMINNQFFNAYDDIYQMHIDANQNLVIAGALWDTTGYSQNAYYIRKLFYKKWDLNGNQIAEKIIPLPNPDTNSNNAFISDTKLLPN